MKITYKKNGNSLIISFEDLINKQLDLSNVTELRKKFKRVLLNKAKSYIMDFNTVDYVDSAVIGFIVDSFNTIRNKNSELKIINVNRNVYEIFEMINLTKFLEIKKR